MKWRTAIGATVLALLSLMQVAAIQVPSGLRVGSETLPARSCATRDTLWIHHYAAALYLPQRAAPEIALQDPQQPKALHVQILSKSFLPRDLPKKWNQALQAELDRSSFNAVQNAWQLNSGVKQALSEAAPVLLEPIMLVTVTVREDAVGDVL